MADVRYARTSKANAKVVREEVLIGNSEVIQINGLVTVLGAGTPGYAEPLGAGEVVHGLCVGVIGPNGELVDNMTLSTGAFVKDTSFTAGADNQTVDQVKAIVEVSPEAVYSMGYTGSPAAGYNLVGYRQDVSDYDTLNAASAVTTVAQMVNVGVDPEDSTRILVRPYEHTYNQGA